MDGEASLRQVILNEFPYPVAVNYRRMLEETNWQAKTDKAIRVFDYALRMVAIGITSQYLCYDAEAIIDSAVNRILRHKILGKKPSLGTWKMLLFSLMDAYHGKRERFFMPELYDAFWDTSVSPHQNRPGVRDVFERLVQIRNEVIHGAPPRDEVGWKGLNRAVLEKLHSALEHLICLKYYDLVHIVSKTEAGAYTCELYKGQEIKSVSKPLRHEGRLEGDWAYVSQDRGRLLELHPWLLFWHDPVKDAALFDHFSTDLLHYLATVSGVNATIKRHPDVIVSGFGLAGINKEIVDEAIIKEFVELVYDTILEVKAERETAERLTWSVLKRKAFQISEQRIGDAQDKYRPQLHHRRGVIEDIFDRFLASDKTGLVLVGESGVGKTHFILRQRRRLQDNPHICTLVYRGTYLDAGQHLPQLITHDFNQFLRLTGTKRGEIEDIFVEINEIPHIAIRDVVLFFDGINESPDARKLLRQIDKLVRDLGILEWLKVVVTCRPETWRTIKRGLSMAKHCYYRPEGQEEFTIEFKHFSREETVHAYQKYRYVYDLQTTWKDIPREMRKTLQHPLCMWLVSETYEGEALLSHLRRDQIFADYIQALRDTGRLESADLAFLRHDLMPLMINETRYDNSISGDTLAFSQSHDGRPMSELIQNDARLSTGRRVNQAFIKLCDAGILIKQELIAGYEIGFQYEGFYEYFGGEQMFQVHKEKSEEQKIAAYRDPLRKINEKPYLWGVLKRALKLELSTLKSQHLVEQLCYTENPMLQDLLVATLREFGDEQTPDAVAPILLSLLSQQVKAIDLESRTAKRIAIRVARHFKMIEPLKIAATSLAESIRALASQEAYYLWRDDHDSGIELLEEVAQDVKGRFGIPRRSVVAFCFIPSFLIVSGHPEDKEAIKSLGNVWQGILCDIGLIAEKQHLARNLIRDAAAGVATRLIIQLARVTKNRSMRWQNPFTIPEIAAFFDLPEGKKQEFRRLLPFLDPERTEIEDAKEIIRRVAAHRDVLSMYLLDLVLTAHAAKSLNAVLEAVDIMFNTGLAMKPAGPAVPYSTMTLATIAGIETLSSEVADKHLELVKRMYNKTQGRYCTATGTDYVYLPITRSTIYYESIIGRNTSLMNDFLEDVLTLSPPNYELLEQVTGLIVDDVIYFEQLKIRVKVAFNLFDLVLSKAGEKLSVHEYQKVRLIVADALAWLRLYRPDDVEDFIATREFSQEELFRIRNKVMETVGDIIARDAGYLASRALAKDLFPGRREEFMRLLNQAVDYRSASQWFREFVKWLINVIHGETAFEIDMPSDSYL